MVFFPERVLRRSQTIACQYSLMQSSEFFNNQCLYGGSFVIWYLVYDGALNAGQWVKLGLQDNLTDCLFDEITPGQTHRVWFCQFLPDRQIFLG